MIRGLKGCLFVLDYKLEESITFSMKELSLNVYESTDLFIISGKFSSLIITEPLLLTLKRSFLKYSCYTIFPALNTEHRPSSVNALPVFARLTTSLTMLFRFYGDKVSISFKLPSVSLTLTSIRLLSMYSSTFFLMLWCFITGTWYSSLTFAFWNRDLPCFTFFTMWELSRIFSCKEEKPLRLFSSISRRCRLYRGLQKLRNFLLRGVFYLSVTSFIR